MDENGKEASDGGGKRIKGKWNITYCFAFRYRKGKLMNINLKVFGYGGLCLGNSVPFYLIYTPHKTFR